MIRGYLRVSTDEQADSGLGIGAQADAIDRRYTEVTYYQETSTAKDLEDAPRPILESLLADIQPGDTLVVSKLDRLSRSVMDFATLLKRARTEFWFIAALDLGVDTSTPTGELVANIVMAVAQWERRMIGQRTKEALAVKKGNGLKLGRPSEVSPELERQIRGLAGTIGPRAIARVLTESKVPAPRGGTAWYPSTVSRILERLEDGEQ